MREGELANERILINGQVTETLREHLEPGLRAVFVGLNPSPVSVRAGHYYQGRLGRRFWNRMRKHGIVPWEQVGAEDELAIKLGFGFADLVRRPTPRGDGLTKCEKVQGAADLLARLRQLGDRPPIVFVFKEAWRFAAPGLERAGFRALRFPSPFTATDLVASQMRELVVALASWSDAGPGRPSMGAEETINPVTPLKALGRPASERHADLSSLAAPPSLGLGHG